MQHPAKQIFPFTVAVCGSYTQCVCVDVSVCRCHRDSTERGEVSAAGQEKNKQEGYLHSDLWICALQEKKLGLLKIFFICTDLKFGFKYFTLESCFSF